MDWVRVSAGDQLWDGTWRSWSMASSIGVRSLLAARRDIPGPGEHQAQHCQMGQGRDCPAQFCAGATSPRGLGAGWGSIKKALRYWRVSKGGHEVGEGSGEALQGVAEGTWFVQVRADLTVLLTSSHREVERHVLISSLSSPVTGLEEMAGS